MFYVLSKILDVFLTPLIWSLALVLAGVISIRRAPVRAAGLSLGGAFVLLFFSIEPVSNFLFRHLESSAPKTYRPDVTYDAVILLGGVVEDREQASNGQPAYNESAERLLSTYDLLRTGKARFAVVSGGAVNESRTQVVEAQALADQLVRWGIAPDRVIVESHARNTYENALDSAAIVRARGWQRVVIVTSAFHMDRAMGCFRAVDLDVDALPVDYRSYGGGFASEWLPRAEHLAASSKAIREWFGRRIYRLRGYAR